MDVAVTVISIRERSSNPLGYFILAFPFTWTYWRLVLFFNPSTLHAELPFTLFLAWGGAPLDVITWVLTLAGEVCS
jgi:hypothetical protein